jgi:putative transposase
MDVGLTVFAMPSVGDPIQNPRFFRAKERALAKAQRHLQIALDTHASIRHAVTQRILAAQPRWDSQQVEQAVRRDGVERIAWRARQRQRRVIARVHERISWRRADFLHQASRRLVNQYDFLAVEDLSVRDMARNHALAKSIHDVAWSQFADLIACKAAWAGRKMVAVNPAYTSQDCSRCGWRNTALTLADRVFHCLNPARPDCQLVLDRDRNAALNILARAHQQSTAVG